jgi:phenylalanine-4-hydroxylase
LSFSDCLVTYEDKVLFNPDWGMYDMAVGETIVSAYSGPADAEGFGLTFEAPAEKMRKVFYESESLKLHELYRKVKKIRNKETNIGDLYNIWEDFKRESYNDWLLPIEIIELTDLYPDIIIKDEVNQYLDNLSAGNKSFKELINNGKRLFSKYGN